jgi:hypothetical protein
MIKKENEIFLSIGFLISLTILILNDLILKSHYPSWITGKLSDFSGLFIFPIFWAVIFPRYKKLIFILTGLIFCTWNSPMIQPLLDWLHSNQIWMDRTVDYSDNIALISLFFAYRYMDANNKRFIKANPGIIAVISIFAFTATSFPPREKETYQINKHYNFNYSIDTLCSRLNAVTTMYVDKYQSLIEPDSLNKTYLFSINGDTVYQKIDLKSLSYLDTVQVISNFAKIKLWGNDSSSTIELIETTWYKKMGKEKDYHKQSEKKFRREIIKELNKN